METPESSIPENQKTVPDKSSLRANDSVGVDVNDLGSSVNVSCDVPESAKEDEFAAFMSDVKSVPSVPSRPPPSSGLLCSDSDDAKESAARTTLIEVDNVNVTWLSGAEEVERLVKLSGTAQMFSALKVPPHASDLLIRKHFKKLSLLIHPDKCNHPRASEAFGVLTKAFEEALKPEHKQEYSEVIEQAKQLVLAERKKSNKKRQLEKKPPLPPYTDTELKILVLERCDWIIADRKERTLYAEQTRKANADLEKQAEQKAKLEEFAKQREKEKWVAERDVRVSNWRSYKDVANIAQHKVDFREARTAEDTDLDAKRRKQMQHEYKQSWR